VSDWRILAGDALTVLRTLPDGGVDAIVTDPPYGLSFMGKDWDHGIPGASVWSEGLRVARPGAHLVERPLPMATRDRVHRERDRA